MKTTPFYAALLGIFFVLLSVRTIRMRKKLKVSLGDAKDDLMLRAIRVHSNFAEYTPLSLLLIFCLEAQRAPSLLLHLLGMCLLIGRVSHAYGVSQINENFKFRISGMILTFTTILTSSFYLIFNYFKNF